MRRLVLIFFVVFLWFFSSLTSSAYAEDNKVFPSYEIIYNVLEDGKTGVNFNIGLTNLTSEYYTSSYSLEVGFQNISNVKASDPAGKIIPEINKTGNGELIKLDFNSRVVGIDKTLNFKLSFDTPDIAKKQGKIWEINIPGLKNAKNYSKFNIHVKVPPGFGKAIYVKPERSLDDLNFTKEELGESGISIAFGDFQAYAFDLSYHLKNSNLFPIKTEIALPPNTNYQDVLLKTIKPEPVNVKVDKDGNWLAEYNLMPGEKKDITVKGNVRLSLFPKKQTLTEEEKKEYLKEKKYWETSNSKIKEIAKNLKTAEQIYNYTVRALKYDFARIETGKPRLGAKKSLENSNSAVCTEFTDLFVALARTAGIPARAVEGFAYTENSKQRPVSLVKDILHAWPEYYDFEKQTWVMVDPTWGNTTGGVDYFNILDFDHFAFVIKGIDSGYPIPAGGYKLPGLENNKDISVDFSNDLILTYPSVDLKIYLPEKLFSMVPLKGYIILENNTGVLFPSQILETESSFLNPKIRKTTIKDIPPFGNLRIPVSFEGTSFFAKKKTDVSFKISGRIFSRTVDISPFYFLNIIKVENR